jgi:transposase
MSGTSTIWKKRVAEWRVSGKTAAAFSAGRGWSPQTLRWWSSRLGRKAQAPIVRVAQVVRAPAGDADARSAGAVVVEALDARLRITIAAGADHALVTTVLAVVAGRRAR